MRARRRIRAWRLGRKLSLEQNNLHLIGKHDVIAFVTVFNEKHRLESFLEYYRKLGIKHFIFIDNSSNDGTAEYLAQFSDVSRYYTDQSYRRAHYGMDWVNWLLLKHAVGRWALVVDADEFLVYPHCEKRPIHALTDWLDASSIQSFGSMLIDMYPEKPLSNFKASELKNPLSVLTHFDHGNYTYMRSRTFFNIWIQGGVRARFFFRNKPDTAPALNKTPLVKWKRGNVFVSSTHQLLPKKLNIHYSLGGSEEICGALLHTKLMPDLESKSRNKKLLNEHYSRAREYRAYSNLHISEYNFLCEHSQKYKDWRQLETLGLISSGGWA